MFTIHRSKENPLLSPSQHNPWEAEATFNGCPIKEGKNIHLFYRAMSHPEILAEPHVSRSIIGKAISTDGLHFDDQQPFIIPEHEYEHYGCEDPRVTKIDSRYYIFYTALGNFPYSAEGIKVALAISDDLKTVAEKHLITPFNAKAMTLFPEKINGKYVVMFTLHSDLQDTNIALAEVDSIEDLWSETYWQQWYEDRNKHILQLHRHGDDQVEVGAPPVKINDGWLIIYSHTSYYFSSPMHRFGIEAVLLDTVNPHLIIGRTKEAFMDAELYYEERGLVQSVVFPTGALLRDEYVDIYYGAADTYCCKATVSLSGLINSILPNKKKLFVRAKENPIITARPKCDWEAHGVFNPASIEIDGTIYILYRAMSSDDTSTVGLALSQDGITITERLSKPIYTPRGDYESKHQTGNSGCEDPRIVEIKGMLYMTYTAYDSYVPRVAVTSISKEDFVARKWKNWTLPEIITPMSSPEKDTCIIPEKMADGYVVLHRAGTSICADILKSLDFSKEKITRCIEILSPRPGMWDSRKVGISAPPIKTKNGWLLLYHGISDDGAYRVGAALLDLKNPTIVLSRTALPVFEPEEPYELQGVVPNVVFPCGTVKRGNTLFVYYGGADTVTCVATTKISSLLEALA